MCLVLSLNSRPLASASETVLSASYGTQDLVDIWHWDTRGAGILKEEHHSHSLRLLGNLGHAKVAQKNPGKWEPVLLSGVHFHILWKQYILEMGSWVLCTKQIVGIWKMWNTLCGKPQQTNIFLTDSFGSYEEIVMKMIYGFYLGWP